MEPTCLHRFLESLDSAPEALAIRIVERAGPDVELSYAQIRDLAAGAVGAYRAVGIKPGDAVILALPTCRDFIALYVGALFGGIVPLIEPVPRACREPDSAPSRLRRQADRISARKIIVQETALALVPEDVEPLAVSVESVLAASHPCVIAPPVDPEAVAHFQSTSGSTGDQRVIAVRHRQIAANVAGIGSVIRVRPPDSLCFWLPLFHDMGLIAVTCSFYWRRPMTITDSSNFIRSPIRFWLQMMSQYRATITAAPNSAYEACARIAALRRYEDLDLSCVRVAFWGAEPIYPRTIQFFENAFGPYGYRSDMTFPVYGLAEATLAAALPAVETPPILSEYANGSAARRQPCVCVGRPLPGHTLRIVDGDQRPLGEDSIGEVQLSGPSVITSSDDGYLATGDLGYLRDGDLYVVGRKKELIIVNGRNFIPAEIEEVIEDLVDNGIHKGVAAIGIVDQKLGSERLHLAIETRTLPVPDQAVVENTIHNRLLETFGLTGTVIRWVSKGKIPKTTSGKIQRFRCGSLFYS
jgi:acyl-CoA synthetase (AMP-forming)/AMP-acid ligase II